MKIANWKKFQHYKLRKPPWIRLYRELLEDPAWMNQSDAAKSLLCELWMVASDKEDGSLPDIEALAWRLRRSVSHVRQALSEINPKFLEDARGPLADRAQDATSEERQSSEQSRGEAERAAEPPMPIPPGVPSYDALDAANAYYAEKRGGSTRYIADCAPALRTYGEPKFSVGWRRFVDSCQGKPHCSPATFAANAKFWCEPESRPKVESPEDEMTRIFARAAAEGFPTGGVTQ